MSDAPRPAGRARPALIAIAATVALLVLIGVGLYQLVRALSSAAPSIPVAEPQSEAEHETREYQRRLGRAPTAPPDAGASGVAADHPYARTVMNGRVFDRDNGDGIIGALVTVRATFGEPHLGPPKGDGSIGFVSGVGGNFALKGIPPGSFDIDIAASGYLPASSKFRKFSAIEDDEGFDYGLARASIIEGRVIDKDGRGVANARIAALVSDTSLIGPQTPTVTSDEDGRFVLDPVAATQVALFVSHPQHEPISQTVPKSADPVRAVKVVLSKGRRIVGVVSGPHGPIEGAVVRPDFLHTQDRGIYFASGESGFGVRTNSEGRYTLSAPATAHLKLRAEAEGYQVATKRVKIGGGKDPLVADFALRPGEAFVGRVLTANGAPARKARVVVTSPTGAFGKHETGPEGRFRVVGLPPAGPYSVSIRHHAHPPLLAELAQLDGEHEYRLDPPGKLLGRIVDAATGLPVTEYGYLLRGPIRMRNVATSASGSLELDQLPAGEYTLTIRAEGYESQTIDGIVVSLGDTVSGVEFRLKQGGTIAGSVRGRKGKGELLVQAFLGHAGDARFENGALVQEDGSFIITNLAAGVYALVAIGSGQRGTVNNVEVSSGGLTDNVEIHLDESR